MSMYDAYLMRSYCVAPITGSPSVMPLEENGGYLKTRDGYRVIIDHLGKQMTNNEKNPKQ